MAWLSDPLWTLAAIDVLTDPEFDLELHRLDIELQSDASVQVTQGE